MDISRTVCVALLNLRVTDDGQLRTGILSDVTVRAALFADLALAGAVTADLLFDEAPTGFDPADRLLAAARVDPTRSLAWWLRHGPVNTHDVAQYLVAQQLWRRSERSVRHPLRTWLPDTRPGSNDDAATRLRSALSGHQARPQARCAAVLAGCAGWLGGSEHHAITFAPRCGDAAWLVGECAPVIVEQRAAVVASDRLARQVSPSAGGMI